MIITFKGNIVLDVFRAPIEITVGVLYGIVTGLLMWLFPTKLHVSYTLPYCNYFFLKDGVI